MALERLWAGWRAEYIDAVVGSSPDSDPAVECLFCGLFRSDPDDAQVVARGEHAYAVLNAFPYTSGHLMVVPNRHEARLECLDAEEAQSVMTMMQHATLAVRAAYAPEGINLGMNLGRAAGAGIPDHLHVHVLPRWTSDTNFMTSVAEARILPEALSRTLERLRAAWPAGDVHS